MIEPVQKDLFGARPTKYPAMPGFKERTTSKDAAAAIAPSLNERQEEVLRELRLRPGTPDEIAARLGRTVLAVRPRFSELGPKNLKLIERTGEKRKNESGLNAAVWRAKEGT